jgi:integrase/recombinase XerD
MERNGFDALLEQFLAHIDVERGLSRATVKAYESDIRRYVDWLRAREISMPRAIGKHDVEAYIAFLDAAGGERAKQGASARQHP